MEIIYFKYDLFSRCDQVSTVHEAILSTPSLPCESLDRPYTDHANRILPPRILEILTHVYDILNCFMYMGKQLDSWGKPLSSEDFSLNMQSNRSAEEQIVCK